MDADPIVVDGEPLLRERGIGEEAVTAACSRTSDHEMFADPVDAIILAKGNRSADWPGMWKDDAAGVGRR